MLLGVFLVFCLAHAEVSSGRVHISSGRAEVSSGRLHISSGRAEVSSGRVEISSGRVQTSAIQISKKYNYILIHFINSRPIGLQTSQRYKLPLPQV